MNGTMAVPRAGVKKRCLFPALTPGSGGFVPQSIAMRVVQGVPPEVMLVRSCSFGQIVARLRETP